MMITSGVILVGGRGSRLKKILKGNPKPLVPILGTPLLEHQVNILIHNKVDKVFLLADYKSDLIKKFMEKKFPKLNFEILVDGDVPLGNGGALLKHINKLPNHFYLLYGDTYFSIDLILLSEFHFEKKSCLTLFTHPNSHPYDSDLVVVRENNRVVDIEGYPHPKNFTSQNLVNAALYVVDKTSLTNLSIEKNKPYDFAKEIIQKIIKNYRNVYSYKSKEYIKDCGTPERLLKIENDIMSGKVAALNKKQKTPTIFLDRDGTIIENVPHLNNISQVKFIPGVKEAIKSLNDSGYLTVIVTNQPVIARGELTIEGLNQIHDFIEWELGKSGAYIDLIKYCPHHPDKGFENEVSELKIKCECRKPSVSLFKESNHELNIDKFNSWIIGDSTADIEAGKVYGINTVLVKTGFAGKDMKYSSLPDYQMENLPEAINFILNNSNKKVNQ